MPTISPANPVVTLVNVFRLHDPANQQRLVDLLVEATEQTMQHQPGFASANIHRSLDGTHVVNYAQWRSAADFDAMRQNVAAQGHMRQAFDLAEVEGHLYEVVHSEGLQSTAGIACTKPCRHRRNAQVRGARADSSMCYRLRLVSVSLQAPLRGSAAF